MHIGVIKFYIVSSGQSWVLPLGNKAIGWDPLSSGMPRRNLLFVEGAQLAGYLPESVSSRLVWDAGIQ